MCIFWGHNTFNEDCTRRGCACVSYTSRDKVIRASRLPFLHLRRRDSAALPSAPFELSLRQSDYGGHDSKVGSPPYPSEHEENPPLLHTRVPGRRRAGAKSNSECNDRLAERLLLASIV